jgi:hypothetical protein
MFSRNLYEIEEVVCLLFQSIHGKRKTEANFWAHELFISHEIDLLKQILNLCALLFAPTYAIYTYTIHAKTTEDYEHLVNVLCFCSNKQMLDEYIVFRTESKLSETKEGLTTNPLSLVDSKVYTKSEIEKIFKETIEKKQILRCASILQSYGLEYLNIEKEFQTIVGSIPIKFQQIAFCAIARWLIQTNFVPYKEPQTHNWSRWSKLQGTKEARLIAINPICLKHWIDRPDKSTKLLGDPSSVFQNGSKYFKQFDLSSESITTTFFEIFKDDIPDEWEEDEKTKSHGSPQKAGSFCDFATLLQNYLEFKIES